MRKSLFSGKWNIYGTEVNLKTDCSLIFKVAAHFLAYFPSKNGQPGSHLELIFHKARRIPYESLSFLLGNEWREISSSIRYLIQGDSLFLDFPQEALVVIDKKNRRAEGLLASNKAFNKKSSFLNYENIFITSLLEMFKIGKFFPLHAAGLSWDGKGILFPGPTGSGKTTISLRLLKAGFKFLGDDRVLLRKNGRLEVLAFPESLRVLPQTFDFLPELADFTREPARQAKYELAVEKFYPGCVQEKCWPKLIAFPVVNPSKGVGAKEISPQESLMRLVSGNLTTWNSSLAKENFEVLSHLAEAIPAYEVAVANKLDSLPEMVHHLLEKNEAQKIGWGGEK